MPRFSIFVALLSLVVSAAAVNPNAVTPDGGRYYGPLVDGKLQGKGRIEWDSGTFYEGEFANGLMSGRGRLHFFNGSEYEGEMRAGLPSGQGELRYADGRRYVGRLVRNRLEGKGRLEMPQGDVYEGEFARDVFNGKGVYTRKDGERWEGTFADGQLQGWGRSSSPMGAYEGNFKDWMFSGKGVLRLANGDVYEGEFAEGMYNGQGTLTHAKALADGRTKESGVWRYGSLANDGERAKMLGNVETALYSQRRLLDAALAALEPRRPGRINLYLLAVAGDGSQEVFHREVDYVRKEFAERFGAGGHTVALVNSRNTVGTAPMATVTSVHDALKGIAARMNLDEDVLFLFMTSHGSQEQGFYLNQNGMQLRSLAAPTLAQLLKESGIRWKVVVVSACYSGGFIEPLQDGRTLVITAARKDRRSFGCADENDFTYFGRAYFKESLPKAASFQDAFVRAEALVREWETRDASQPAEAGAKAVKAGDENRSFPQISSSSEIEGHLRRLWQQTRSAQPRASR